MDYLDIDIDSFKLLMSLQNKAVGESIKINKFSIDAFICKKIKEHGSLSIN